MRAWLGRGAIVAGFLSAVHWRAAPAEERIAERERTVCGPLLERLAFASWSAAAGKPTPDGWRTVTGAEPVTHRTADGRHLHGFRISQPGERRTAGGAGYVLFVQGNAMLAD